MKKNLMVSLWFVLILTVIFSISIPVTASPHPQVVYQTPTAGADGRVIYIVNAGDSCLSISLKTGLDVNQLRLLNNLDEDCALFEGQELLLGIVQEPSATIGPSPTPIPEGPTPTPFDGNGTICVFLYNDINGNALAEENEAVIPDGEVSITDRQGEVSRTGTTFFGLEPLCFEDIPEGEYNISVAAPEGYNPTTLTNYALSLKAGESSTLDFGAQISSLAVPTPVSEGGRSPILGIMGGILVLAGAGLGIYVWRLKK